MMSNKKGISTAVSLLLAVGVFLAVMFVLFLVWDEVLDVFFGIVNGVLCFLLGPIIGWLLDFIGASLKLPFGGCGSAFG